MSYTFFKKAKSALARKLEQKALFAFMSGRHAPPFLSKARDLLANFQRLLSKLDLSPCKKAWQMIC
jgi:hypothetical protein